MYNELLLMVEEGWSETSLASGTKFLDVLLDVLWIVSVMYNCMYENQCFNLFIAKANLCLPLQPCDVIQMTSCTYLLHCINILFLTLGAMEW